RDRSAPWRTDPSGAWLLLARTSLLLSQRLCTVSSPRRASFGRTIAKRAIRSRFFEVPLSSGLLEIREAAGQREGVADARQVELRIGIADVHLAYPQSHAEAHPRDGGFVR